MSIKERLDQDMKEAMRNKEKEKLSIIRIIKSEIKNAEIDNKGEILEDKVIAIIQKLIKQSEESRDAFLKKEGYDEDVNKLNVWLEVLNGYLPKQLTEDEVRTMISEVITTNGFSGKKDMGKVMKEVMSKVSGRTTGDIVKNIVSELLG